MPTIAGTDARDTLVGGLGDDSIDGGGGDDLLRGGAGNDTLSGGAGVDTASFDGATAGVTASLIFGTATGQGDDRLSGIENLDGGAGNDRLTGDPGRNVLRGGAGDDSLTALQGDDELWGDAGRDTLSGGEGRDRFVFVTGDAPTAAPDVITDWSPEDGLHFGLTGAYQEASAPDAGRSYANSLIASGARIVAMQTPDGVIVYADSAGNGGEAEVAVLLAGRTLADISGANVGSIEILPTAPMGTPDPNPPAPPPPPPPQPPANQTLTGTAGADTLAGGAGDDSISGAGGDDLISGGAGNDTLSGGDGIDTLDYSGATGGVSVALVSASPLQVGGGQGSDVVFGFERLVGSAFADRLEGGTGSDTIHGGAGNDTLVGVLGQDELNGGEGDDRISGGGSLNGGAGSDTLSAGTGHAGARLDGGAGDDYLGGTALRETLVGGDGNDTINGSLGKDELYGGAGRDDFMFSGGHSLPSDYDSIHDWETVDRLLLTPENTPRSYAETTAETYEAALQLANARIAADTANFVSVQVGSDVFVFVDTSRDNGTAEDAIRLVGRSLDDIAIGNFFRGAEVIPEAEVPAPPVAPGLGDGANGSIAGNMDTFSLTAVYDAVILAADDTTFQAAYSGASIRVSGSNIAYANNQIVGGTVSALSITVGNGGAQTFAFHITHRGFPADPLDNWLAADATQLAFSTILAGNDRFTGGGTDLLRGYAGNDYIQGLGGADTIFGGVGNDVIFAGQLNVAGAAPAVGGTYLRGDEGDDYIIGGLGFDDINGNMGADTASGGAGDDWVVGGKDNDLLFGDADADLVYGNLGNDTCYGGAGNDVVRGGQNDDVVNGGGGDDYVSGDRGDDTVTGGTGADLFHTFGDAGIDRVTDFKLLEGDRVLLDAGTQYTVAQVGEDTVISMTGGGQMILVGVQMSSLTPGWIFGA